MAAMPEQKAAKLLARPAQGMHRIETGAPQGSRLVTKPQLFPVPAKRAQQPVQSCRGVGNPAIPAHRAADAAVGHRHCDPLLMNLKSDI
jgi:hypothetical protein